MKNWFFHQEKGTTLGPITLVEIKSRVREGRIRLFDLVYREGESGWCMALEHPDLKNEFKTSTVKTLVDRPWVCLQRKSETGFDFGTSGPFSTEDIRLSIQEGLVSYSDYVWRESFSEWRRIGSVEDFNPRLRRGVSEPNSQPPPFDVPAQELLKNVVEMKRDAPPPNPAVPPPAPPEAATPDLTAPGAEFTVHKKRRGKHSAGPSVEEAPDHKKPSRRRSTAAWVDWMVVGVLAVVLGAVAVSVNQNLNNQIVVEEAPRVDPSPVAEEPALAGAPEPTTSPEPEFEAASDPPPELPPDLEPSTEAVKTEKRAPTELILNVQSTGPNQVKIELRTDASGDEYPVYVQIVGLPGQVSDGASYYKLLRLNPKGDRKEALDLSGMSLPQGRFILRAETGSLKKEAKLNVGVNEAAFKQTVARLRKIHAHAIWKERLELFRLSQLLEKQLIEALGGRKFGGKGLEAVNGVKRSSGAKYILYDQWFEMKEILTAAKTAPSMALLGRLKQARERLATFSVWK